MVTAIGPALWIGIDTAGGRAMAGLLAVQPSRSDDRRVATLLIPSLGDGRRDGPLATAGELFWHLMLEPDDVVDRFVEFFDFAARADGAPAYDCLPEGLRSKVAKSAVLVGAWFGTVAARRAADDFVATVRGERPRRVVDIDAPTGAVTLRELIRVLRPELSGQMRRLLRDRVVLVNGHEATDPNLPHPVPTDGLEITLGRHHRYVVRAVHA
jgi:hypothetical protein